MHSLCPGPPPGARGGQVTVQFVDFHAFVNTEHTVTLCTFFEGLKCLIHLLTLLSSGKDKHITTRRVSPLVILPSCSDRDPNTPIGRRREEPLMLQN